MKLRVVKKENGRYVPEYWNEEERFPGWKTCHTSNNLVDVYFWNLEEAQKECEEYAKKYIKERGEIVWTKEI